VSRNHAARWLVGCVVVALAFVVAAQDGDACTGDWYTNVRSGPDIAFSIARTPLPPRTCGIDIVRSVADDDPGAGWSFWYEIEVDGRRGWVANTLLIVTDTRAVFTPVPTPSAIPTIPPTVAALLTATPTPTVQATPTPEPAPQQRQTELHGEVLRWRIVIEISEVVP
jgi:hypothetical protein